MGAAAANADDRHCWQGIADGPPWQRSGGAKVRSFVLRLHPTANVSDSAINRNLIRAVLLQQVKGNFGRPTYHNTHLWLRMRGTCDVHTGCARTVRAGRMKLLSGHKKCVPFCAVDKREEATASSIYFTADSAGSCSVNRSWWAREIRCFNFCFYILYFRLLIHELNH